MRMPMSASSDRLYSSQPSTRSSTVRVKKNRIAAKCDGPMFGVIVQAALEPEEIFQDIERRKPVRLIIHELHAALEHLKLWLLEHDGVHNVEDVGVDVVFGVEDRHDLIAGAAQAHIQAMRLVDGAIIEADHARRLDASRPQHIDFLLRLLDGAGIIDRADDDAL